MSIMDERISAWALAVAPDERRNGPTLQDLGGLEAVQASADHFTTGPFLGYLVCAAAHEKQASELPIELQDVIVDGLAKTTRHSAFAHATDALAANPGLARALGARCTSALLGRITEVPGSNADPAAALIGAEAVDCLVQLTLAHAVTPARVLGVMDEISEDPSGLPIEFARRFPRLLGVMHAHHPTAGLRDGLERFLMPEDTFRDAAFELALSDLRMALEENNYEAIAEGLESSRRRFADLNAVDPDRLDAEIYGAGIDGLLGLSSPDAPERVREAVVTLRHALARYGSWRARTSTPAWARSREDDIIAWAELTTLLSEAAQHMGNDDPWYDHSRGILTALLRAYTAYNTVTVLTEAPARAVIETMVAPVVEDSFLRHENRLLVLEYALTHDDGLRADPDAQRLKSVLSSHLAGHQATNSGVPVEPGKARRWQQLARELPGDFPALLELSPDVLDRLELRLRNSEDFLASIADPKYSRLMSRLIEELRSSSDWVPGIAEPFQVLLEATVRFAYRAYDVGRTMGGSYTEYLRLRDKSQKKQKVSESLFHQHFREVLSYTALWRQVHSEVIDKAGGRADILFTFNTAQFNVECKIEEDDASEKSLRKYLAQAVEYQNTSASFAILLVLDKTVGAEGAINLPDSIWTQAVRRPGEAEPCLVVTIRVPGGRESPNQLRLAPD